MYRVVKERNFIASYDEANKCVGKINILTCQYIGKSGAIVQTKPACFTENNLTHCSQSDMTNLIKNLSHYLDWFKSNNSRVIVTPERLARFEQLISLGLIPSKDDVLNDTIPLTKNLVEYLKTYNDSVYARRVVDHYILTNKYNAYLTGKTERFKDLFFDLIKNLPVDYVRNILSILEKEHMLNYFSEVIHSWRLSDIIKQYYFQCMEMYGSVRVERNILTNMAYVNDIYITWRNTHTNEIIREYNDKPFLYFENKKYFARPLLTKEAFHDEAEQQSNCVERCYMDRVMKGETYIVQIRRKDTPEISFVTCEVTLQGEIVQYLKRFNWHLAVNEDDGFKELYAEHLREALKI